MDIIVQSRLDQSTDAVNKLKQDVASLEKKLKSNTIKLQVDLDDSTIQKLKNQFADIQTEVTKLRKSANFNDMTESLKGGIEGAEQMSRAVSKIREQSELISSRVKFNLLTGEDIQHAETYRKSLLEVQKIVTTFKEGKVSTKIEDTNLDYLKAQKSLYAEIIRLENELFGIEKQILKASDEQKAKLEQQKAIRLEMVKERKDFITSQGLVNQGKEDELKLSRELKAIQLEISKVKDVDSRSRQTYAELSRLAKEELSIQQAMISADGEHLNILNQKMEIVKSAQEGLNSQVNSKTGTLYNEQRHNQLLEERKKLKLDLMIKEDQMAQKESARLQKLGVEYAKLNGVDFGNDQSLRNYISSLEGGSAEVTNFSRTVDGAGNSLVRMTVTSQTSANKIKQMKLVVDENSQSIRKMSEATKLNSNRMLGFVQQMNEAIKKSVTWGISMGLLYGSLRKFKDGIQIVKDLDAELTQVAITTGKTREETKQLALEYAQLGREMGKTVAEISKVNTELVRQGLSGEESFRRMQTVLKLSASSGMDANQTLSVITSSVNALGEDAEKTADILLKSGQLTASSAEEVGEALTKTASSAKSTGMSLEQLGAVLSTLVEVTQESPSSLGNSLKTLLARFNKIDEITGEVNQDFNNVQKAFESVGIAFVNSEGQIRPLYELLEELSLQWGDLDQNTKMYIATQGAGVRQANRFLATMDNFNRVQQINNDLMGAGGTLNKSYAKYLDSVEASANRARASFEEMWIKAIDSEAIKKYYEAITAINTFIGNVGVLNVALFTLSGIMLLNNKNFLTFSGKGAEAMRLQIIKLWQGATQTKVAVGALGTATKMTAGSMGVASGASSILKAGFTGVKLGAIGARLAVIALQTALTVGFSLAITAVIAGLTSWIGSFERAKQKTEELTQSVKANTDTYKSNINTLRGLKKEYDTLNKKLGENRDFTRLTANEQDRYNSIAQQLEQIAPEIVTAYDEKGNAVTAYKTTIEELIEREKELIRLEQSKLLSRESEVVASTDKEIKNKEKKLKSIENQIEMYKGALNGDDRRDYSGNTRESIAKSRIAYSKSTGEQRAELVKLNAERRVLLQDIETEKNKQKELLDIRFAEMDAIDGITDSMKKMAREKVSEILDEEGYKSAVSAIGQFEETFENMLELINSNSITEGSVKAQEVKDSLIQLGYSADETETILYKLVNGLEATEEIMGRVAGSIITAIDGFKEMKDTVQDLDSTFGKLASGKDLSSDELMDLVDKYEEVAKYIAETGDLSLQNGELIKNIKDKHLGQLENEVELEEKRSRRAVENARIELEAQQQKLSEIENRLGTENRLYQQQAETVGQLNDRVKTLEGDLFKATARARALDQIFTQTFRNSEIENYGESFKAVTDKLQVYHDILKEIDEHGRLSGETNRKIVQEHSELINFLGHEGDMRLYLMELIDQYKDRQMEAYRNSLMASEQFSRKFVSQNEKLFSEIAKIYNIDLENFSTLQSLKMQMMEKSVRVMSEVGNAHLSKFGEGLERTQAELSLVNQAIYSLGATSGTPSYVMESIFSKVGTNNINELKQRQKELEAMLELQKKTDAIKGSFDIDIDFDTSIKSSSTSTKKTYQRVDAIELLTDRYIKFKKALDEVERSLERNNQILDIATGKDKISLLGKEIELLKEKQKILHLTANEYRRERDELSKNLSKKINLNDGTLGADSFKVYSQNMEKSINSIVAQINASTNDTLRDKLSEQKDTMKKAYDELKGEFERYLELQNQIPDLGTDWWTIEIDKFNKATQILETDLKKYANEIDHVNDKLSLMITVRQDNIEEVEKEYQLIKDISKVYQTSLKDIEERMKGNAELIAHYEGKINSLGNTRNEEYKRLSQHLIMVRAEQDKLFEAQREGITALANQQKSVIDGYMTQLNYAREETIKSLQDIRKEMDGFNQNEFEISIEKILADLDKIDKIFVKGADFSLSTTDARKDLKDWGSKITETLDKVNDLQKEAQDILSVQAKTEEEQIAKREKLLELIEMQIGKENDLKDLRVQIREEIEKTAIEYQKIEDALEAKIEARQEELKQLHEQFEQEDKIRDMLEKQLALMGAMDDARHSYITGMGEEIFTYDQSKVAEIQREISQMKREDEREKMVEAIQDEIAKMQENLATTKEIHRQELEVLKLAQEGIGNILNVISNNIEDNLGKDGLEKIYEDMGNTFIDNIKEAMQPFVDSFENIWKSISDRLGIEKVSDEREINQEKLDPNKKKATQPTQPKTTTQSKTSQTTDYYIKPNETLSKIAKDFGTSVQKILELNPQITNPSLVFPNQKIKIPKFDTGGYTGSWGAEGRLGVLHEKELILNKSDTANILEAVNLARSMYNSLSDVYNRVEKPAVINNSNEGSKSVVLNNPVFQGVHDVGRFANELDNLFRRGMPSMS